MSTTLIVLFALGGCVIAAVVALLCGALLEVFRQLESIRVITRLDDYAIPLELRAQGMAAAEIGIPIALDEIPEAIVVFLSGRCSTCRTIASAFKSGAPEHVWFILEADQEVARNALLALLAGSADRAMWDQGSVIADTIGLDVMPSVVSLSYGRLTRAYGISSVKQVLDLLPAAQPAQMVRSDAGPTLVPKASAAAMRSSVL